MNKKLEDELKNSNFYRGRGKYYRIKKCKDCGNEYIGGTNSRRCYVCNLKAVANRQKNNKYKKIENLPQECKFCYSNKRLQIHHIDANNKNNEYKNLLILCIHCHHVLHGKIYKRIFNPKIREVIKNV